jgi:isopentenyl diphosphate isomerase/L-lactate dehydrogenase-like FMN-dependent dehydrogenase
VNFLQFEFRGDPIGDGPERVDSRRSRVMVDGGVRSGVDIFKALALGARGVMIGRPWIWALAGAGQAGLESLLATFRRELKVAMALTGVSSINQIRRDCLDDLVRRDDGCGAV